MRISSSLCVLMLSAIGASVAGCGQASAADPSAAAAGQINGQVLGAGAPIIGSTVTVWAASTGQPATLGQGRTGADGRFSLALSAPPGPDASLYVIAKGGRSALDKTNTDNPAIALMAVVGNQPPPNLVVNEMSTVASVWTHGRSSMAWHCAASH